MKPSTGFGAFLLLLSGLGAIFLMLNLRGIVPSPEQYAAATATAQRAADESARYQIETQATATYVARRIEALPAQVRNEIDTENTNRTSASLAQIGILAGGVVCGVLILLAVRIWIKRRAQTVSRDQTGQLPAYVVEDKSRDTHLVNLQAIPAASVPSNGGIVQAVGFETAEQTLAAFVAALGPTNIAALMSGERTDAERKQRLQLVKTAQVKDPFGNVVSPSSTNIIVSGPAVQAICENIGVTLVQGGDTKPSLPDPIYPQIEAPAAETQGALGAWTEVGAGAK
jgi:hypothetical protein